MSVFCTEVIRFINCCAYYIYTCTCVHIKNQTKIGFAIYYQLACTCKFWENFNVLTLLIVILSRCLYVVADNATLWILVAHWQTYMYYVHMYVVHVRHTATPSMTLIGSRKDHCTQCHSLPTMEVKHCPECVDCSHTTIIVLSHLHHNLYSHQST